MTAASNNIAWIGVGKMGLPLSVPVGKAGYAVAAFD
jgi:3-hydroxyisobutyrate dehydrogenase-like beta-hydroxyacid dehydrogenase